MTRLKSLFSPSQSDPAVELCEATKELASGTTVKLLTASVELPAAGVDPVVDVVVVEVSGVVVELFFLPQAAMTKLKAAVVIIIQSPGPGKNARCERAQSPHPGEVAVRPREERSHRPV